MKTQVAIAFAAFFGLLVAVSCQEQGQVYCGRRLASTLAMLCENGLIKRSGLDYGRAAEELPWIPLHLAKRMSRGKRQVVTECCEKPCTLDELLSYCA